jgi:hypothetical protein
MRHHPLQAITTGIPGARGRRPRTLTTASEHAHDGVRGRTARPGEVPGVARLGGYLVSGRPKVSVKYPAIRRPHSHFSSQY